METRKLISMVDRISIIKTKFDEDYQDSESLDDIFKYSDGFYCI